MTFFELEKECKKRKKIKIAFIILSFLSILSIFIVSFYKEKEIKKTDVKKTVKNLQQKEKNISKIKNTKTLKKQKDIAKNRILKPIIDLNITLEKQNLKKQIKEKKIKKENAKKILLTSTLPSFETCINLAENYYNHKDYKKALKWAKNANIQNKKNPKSWIIVAKSLYKLGEKEKAIKVLEIYYKYTKNKSILNLIKRIKNNEI